MGSACQFRFASWPSHAYSGSDVTVPRCASPPLEVSLEDPLPPHASSSIGNRFPPVGFKPPPGLPTPPGLDMPPLAGFPQDMPRTTQNTSVDQVSVVPKTKTQLSTGIESDV